MATSLREERVEDVPAPPRIPTRAPYEPVLPGSQTTSPAGSSTLFSLLGLVQLIAGIWLFVAPYMVGHLFFGQDYHLPADLDFESAARILGTILLLASVMLYTLKLAADEGNLGLPSAKRLMFSLAMWAALVVLLHLVYFFFIHPKIKLWGLLVGATIMLSTLAVPSTYINLGGGIGSMVTGYIRAGTTLFTPARISTSLVLYSVLTMVFTVVGLAYLCFPQLTLRTTFNVYSGTPAAFLWQLAGSGLLLLVPAITFTKVEAASLGRLQDMVPRSLNVGLLIASLVHVILLGGILTAGITNRPLLPVAFTLWVVSLFTSLLGLTSHGASDVPESYEPLV